MIPLYVIGIYLGNLRMIKVISRSFSSFAKAYKKAVETHAIREDACQMNVVRYLDRFQDVIERYHRGTIPNVHW